MLETYTGLAGSIFSSPSGLRAQFNANGSLRRFDCNAISLALLVGNEMESGPTNLYLRRRSGKLEWTALLGPNSPTRFHADRTTGAFVGVGAWHDIHYSLALVLAHTAPVWFWHLRLENLASTTQEIDLTYTQDVALASYGAIRLNEYYVSQYLDHTPLRHPKLGVMVASRQNLAVDSHYPWCLLGSVREGTSFATDARQFHGLAGRVGATPIGLESDLPSQRLQHEHAMVAIRDTSIRLEPRSHVTAGFFGLFEADHPTATSPADAHRADEALRLVEAAPTNIGSVPTQTVESATLFSTAPLLHTLDLDTQLLEKLFGAQRRHEELDEHGELLSFFCGNAHHVVLREKELRVLRPHGHLLRTGLHTTPDETGLTSTTWMSGVFNSMVTQGHVSINRFLSTVHTYLGLFRSHGQRVFVEIGQTWRLLGVPSAFEMSPHGCRWIYRHDSGVIEVRTEACNEPQELTLSVQVLSGAPMRCLVSHHVALNDDDGSTPGHARWDREGDNLIIVPAPNTDLARRFPSGRFRIAPLPGTEFQQVGGDELLFLDQKSRQQPFLCLMTTAVASMGLTIRGELVPAQMPAPLRVERAAELTLALHMSVVPTSPLAERLARLTDMVPWYTQNAWVHYLSPRGLEQYSGGGWGTRDVCQGPVEMLLALDRPAAIRDVLLRVMRQQNPDGDWPQWFMFLDRERGIRPGDSHGDIVFWPLLVLAQYLIASGDRSVLDEKVPFFDGRGADAGEQATVWQHVQRAFSLIAKRLIPGTALAAYGHGDWNDSLQPADPALREHMCSAWTVTLHFQTLGLLARALRGVDQTLEADRLESQARAIHNDFQRLLLVDGVIAGYAIFQSDGSLRYLLHPRDQSTGVKYSSLAIIHAIIEDLLTPAQAREHLRLIHLHTSAPDGARLFDRPMPYHGGPQRIFQRAESATFFGREIGLMYTHAHLRYAQALAHVGEAEQFFHALCLANPIGIRAIVPAATLRQANCYYSSSDAAFADRYQASEEYDRVARGAIALDGGWRVYSSGAGIALGLIVRHFLGLDYESDGLSVDPVIAPALNGLRVETTLRGRPVEVRYRIGSAGCGVLGIALNGQTLIVRAKSNPHRRAGASIALPSLEANLRAAHNVLEISVG